MKISVTLPTLFPSLLSEAVRNINSATRSPVEILVVSPFEATGKNVVWIRETSQRGVAAAQHEAGMHATGDFVAASADDYRFSQGWDERLIPDFLQREQKHDGRYVMGMRYAVDDMVGTVFGIYYPNFPFMRREAIEKYGWISPDYRQGFGDCDLGMRVWNRGGVCEFSLDAPLKPLRSQTGSTLDHVRKKSLAADEDIKLFVSRWAPHYGNGWDTSTLRGFNLDVGLFACPYVLEGDKRTIYNNNVKFRSLIGAPRIDKAS